MNLEIPRLRMFAGPNGSGKSTIKEIINSDVDVNSYFAFVCADFIRKKLLEARKSFTFETVMSSYDKIELLKLAKKLGYRNYLYYVATSDPIINISRVKNRVALKGHDVPEDKIVSRYYRSLDYLKEAVKLTDRAYIFDNSSRERTWICEITDGSKVDMKVEIIPKWVYKYLLEPTYKNNIGN